MKERGYESYKDVCQDCPLNKPQRIEKCKVLEFEWSQYYLDIDLSLRPAYCRHFTCGDGLKVARNIAQSNRLIKWLIRKEVVLNTVDRVEAYPFGTDEKPFVEVERYITDQGQIITTDVRGNHHLSPQRVRIR